LSFPVLHRPLPLHGVVDGLMLLEIDELMQVIALGEGGYKLVLVLPDTLNKVCRGADIERPKPSVGEDVDPSHAFSMRDERPADQVRGRRLWVGEGAGSGVVPQPNPQYENSLNRPPLPS